MCKQIKLEINKLERVHSFYSFKIKDSQGKAFFPINRMQTVGSSEGNVDRVDYAKSAHIELKDTENVTSNPVQAANPFKSFKIINKYTVNVKYLVSNYELDIKREEIDDLTRLAVLSCACFPPTGLLSLWLAYKMRGSYFDSNYEQAIRFKRFLRLTAILNVLLAILVLLLFVFVLKM